jgi:hypothetical protein
MTTIPLGFEVGTGTPVAVPLKHLAITGQTQEAGKTTALEALITRSGLRALTFVTKRGEGAFVDGRPTAPYFREQADWRFVSSMLEAFLGERLKFERSWIMRATKGARTLADVQRNIVRLREKAKGLNADVFMVLGEYLDELVPAIAAVTWAPRVALAAGVNVMDLSAVPGSMQHLVIKSSIDWVLEHEEQTVVVVPEAWKFIPQGRGTPVKLSAMAYIRQGAALENYLWLDSQDLGGVDKELLRSVPLWILGVQREANEIKRTLSNIPASVAKPSAAAIATLELGQFFACWGKHAMRTYVQPAWMPEDLARQVAGGGLDVANASAIARAKNVKLAAAARHVLGVPKEETVTKDEAAALRRENTALHNENVDLKRRLEALEKGQHAQGSLHDRRRPVGAGGQNPPREPGAQRKPGDHAASVGRDRAAAAVSTLARDVSGAASLGHPDFSQESENFYQAVKARLLDEAPALLRLIVERPELEVSVERHVITAEGSTTLGRVARLIAADFLEESRRFREILVELERTGTRVNNKSLSIVLKDLVVGGFLTKESVDRYRAVPDMKVNVVEAA